MPFEYGLAIFKYQDVTPEAPVWLRHQTFEKWLVIDLGHHGSLSPPAYRPAKKSQEGEYGEPTRTGNESDREGMIQRSTMEQSPHRSKDHHDHGDAPWASQRVPSRAFDSGRRLIVSARNEGSMNNSSTIVRGLIDL
jgi:hypothetical protein